MKPVEAVRRFWVVAETGVDTAAGWVLPNRDQAEHAAAEWYGRPVQVKELSHPEWRKWKGEL